jgi:hypothetical protein
MHSDTSATSSFSIKLVLKTKLRGELHRPSYRLLSAKLVSTFADRGCGVVSATDPPAVNSVFLTGAATSPFK